MKIIKYPIWAKVSVGIKLEYLYMHLCPQGGVSYGMEHDHEWFVAV